MPEGKAAFREVLPKQGRGGRVWPSSARPQRAARSPPACPLPRAALDRGRPRHGAVQAQGAAPQVGGAGEAGGAAAGGGRGGREGLRGGAGLAALAPGPARPQVGGGDRGWGRVKSVLTTSFKIVTRNLSA